MKVLFLIVPILIVAQSIYGAPFVNLDFEQVNTNNVQPRPNRLGMGTRGHLTHLLYWQGREKLAKRKTRSSQI